MAISSLAKHILEFDKESKACSDANDQSLYVKYKSSAGLILAKSVLGQDANSE